MSELPRSSVIQLKYNGYYPHPLGFYDLYYSSLPWWHWPATKTDASVIWVTARTPQCQTPELAYRFGEIEGVEPPPPRPGTHGYIHGQFYPTLDVHVRLLRAGQYWGNEQPWLSAAEAYTGLLWEAKLTPAVDPRPARDLQNDLVPTVLPPGKIPFPHTVFVLAWTRDDAKTALERAGYERKR